jgi:diadenosine tetraphosphate (Ap4A) HIT family hydrolase
MVDCMACRLSSGDSPLPGGRIFRTRFWLVEHCVGPLGLGTLIVKPERHVTSVADLTEDEAAELAPLLWRSSQVASQLVEADQVYNCLWSHADGEPVHIHYVVQPVTKEQMSDFAAHGPSLQVAMLSMGVRPIPLTLSASATSLGFGSLTDRPHPGDAPITCQPLFGGSGVKTADTTLMSHSR